MAKERSKFQQKLDGFLRTLFFEESGKPKSADLLYSFLLAILFTVIYLAAYVLLLGAVENLFSGCSVTVRNIAEYILPALAGSLVCLLIRKLLKEKGKLALAAYLWMAALLIASMLFALLLIDWSDARTEYGLFMALLGLPALCSVVIGGIPAFLLHRRERRKKEQEAAAEKQKAKERPSWYR
ncbi:MAG: hypothetical protein IJK77_06455 [Lachnospiraceae bacterium]|nr:hypothetical protein [Lachnospiraceae bacterium]